jgi:hypothetical protein
MPALKQMSRVVFFFAILFAGVIILFTTSAISAISVPNMPFPGIVRIPLIVTGDSV